MNSHRPASNDKGLSHDTDTKKTGLADSPFFREVAPQTAASAPPPAAPKKKTAAKKETPTVKQPAAQPVDQPVNQSTGQSVDQSTGAVMTTVFTVDMLGPVVARPRSFYITQKVDRWLDEAVRHLRDSGLHKADRSVLVNTLLHNPELFTPQELDKLRERILVHLTNRTLRRSESTS